MAVGARESAPIRLGSYGSGRGLRQWPNWGKICDLCCGSLLPGKRRSLCRASSIPLCGHCSSAGDPAGLS
eukprot:1659877-Heterocapsa_arctica.AAC.1